MVEQCIQLRSLAIKIKEWRYCVITFWILMAIGFAYPSMGLISLCKNQFPAPKGTDAYRATEAYNAAFPDLADTCTHVVYIECRDQSDVTTHPELAAFDAQLAPRLLTYKRGANFTFQYVSYWTLRDKNFSGTEQFLSKQRTATFIDVAVRASSVSDEIMDWSKWAQDQLDDLNPDSRKYVIELVGVGPVTNVALNNAQSDFEKIDAISIPLATAVFCCLLQTWRFVLLPLFTMGVALACSFGTMYILGASHIGMSIFSVAPNLMMCILVAMSFDYSLFLLVRFQEELRRSNESVELAVENSMVTSGFTITISGWTMIVCFLSLFCFPISIISSLGVGAAISLLFVWLVNLTLFPALLNTCPNFFKKSIEPCICCMPFQKSKATGYDTLAINKESDQNGFWWKVASIQTRFPYNLIIFAIITTFTCVLIPSAMNDNTTDGIKTLLPKGADETDAYISMGEQFGYGYTVDLRLLMIAPQERYNGTILSKDFFDTSQKIIDDFVSDPRIYDTHIENFAGVSYLNGTKVPYLGVKVCQEYPMVEGCEQLLYEYDTFVNDDDSAAYFSIFLYWDPLSYHMNDWYKSALDFLAEQERETGLELHLMGLPADVQDNIKVINEWFPAIITVTCVGVLIIVGFLLKSILIPLRSLLSMAVTVIFVYGVARLSYVEGILNWMSFDNVSNSNQGTQFLIPVSCFAIIIGISLDYDIFLITRIREYRAEGKSTQEAIVHGVANTGHLITAAGIVMACAFGGLLSSTVICMAQFGFYLVMAVLFDTFIVRSFFVPSAMSMIGRYNWWPSDLSKEVFQRNHTTIDMNVNEHHLTAQPDDI